MGKSRKINQYIPNRKADIRYRRKAFERNKRMIESEERIFRKLEKEYEQAEREFLALTAKNVGGDTILVHGAMKYGCENCGMTWWMFLEKGIEEFGPDHKPSPFVISCPLCGGFARDISGIVKFPNGEYRELPEGEAYFANVDGRDCGVAMTQQLVSKFRFG